MRESISNLHSYAKGRDSSENSEACRVSQLVRDSLKLAPWAIPRRLRLGILKGCAPLDYELGVVEQWGRITEFLAL